MKITGETISKAPFVFGALVALRAGALYLAVLMTLAAPTGAAMAQETQGQTQEQPQANVEIFKDWFLQCASNETTERCYLIQELVDQTNNRPLMQIAAGFWGPEYRRAIVVRLPLGVILPPGIEFKIDSEVIGRVPFRQCAPNGCEAVLPLGDPLLAKLKGGAGGTVTFRDGRNRNLPIPFSLQGFTAGIAKIR